MTPRSIVSSQCMTPSRWPRLGRLMFFVVLPLSLCVMNLFLRCELEQASQRLHSHMAAWYAPGLRELLEGPVWRWFLPLDDFHGSIIGPSYVLVAWLEQYVSTANIYYTTNALIILTTFFGAWHCSNSRTITSTLAIVAAFSTQNAHVYQSSAIVSLNLFYLYFLFLLLASYLYLFKRERSNWIAFFLVFTTALTALSFEAWLDYYATLLLLAPVAIWGSRAMGRPIIAKRILKLTLITTAMAVPYVIAKVSMGWKYQGVGQEADVITNYKLFRPMIEDALSNFFSFLHLAVANFIPSSLIHSTVIDQYGKDWLLSQHGINPTGSIYETLTVMNSIFYWRFFAGAIAASLLLWTVQSLRNLKKGPSPPQAGHLPFVVGGNNRPPHPLNYQMGLFLRYPHAWLSRMEDGSCSLHTHCHTTPAGHSPTPPPHRHPVNGILLDQYGVVCSIPECST